MGLWLVMLWVFSMPYAEVDAFFDWLKSAPAPDPAPAPPEETIAPIVLHGETPAFEMSVVDEKFLAEAKQMELSPLDRCHFRVVAQLKAACSGLSEEQLAKLGVALFNCQSEVEGRRTYPCTEEMSIKECTADMDSDTWNAYHIVSNRARSVCYATRQQHFRKRAELTVNALISTATNQLDTMKDLKEGQKELKEMTAASLDKLLEGHSALQLQQGALKEGQGQLDASISQNLQRLAQEKALISTGQQLVAQLIQGITQRMENVSGQLKDQSAEVQEGHQAILEDLAVVRGSAQDIYEKMELNLNGFLQQQNTTARFYSELMTKLERMNGTLGYMLTYLDRMQRRLEDRLLMIQGYLGWAGRWFVLQMLWVLSEIKGQTCSPVPLPIGPPKEKTPAKPSRSTEHWQVSSSTPVLNDPDCDLEVESFMMGDPDLLSMSPSQSHGPQFRHLITGTPNHSTPRLKSRHSIGAAVLDYVPQKNLVGVLETLNHSRSSSPNHSLASNSSFSGRLLCSGITRLGQPCKKRAVVGQDYCRLHEGGHTSYSRLRNEVH
ncbi:protein brambleberry-like isoform X2 [Carassius auratus]|uniref:Protein brambleberry-like isoform X2 n=1 Tax=Carassius auratus TaxID=7957 RepID=A0A6P6MFS2_CARAU|nr:protein brambleberry-like isoform X2 [Carassius auratus]